MTIFVIILLLLISKKQLKSLLWREKSNVSVCCFCPFSCGSLSFSEWAELLWSHLCHLLFLSPRCFLFHHQHVTLFSPLYFPFFCSVHGITTVCASTAVRASALAVPMCTNTTICPRLPLTLAWLLHSKKATDSDVWFYSVYFLCDLLISMLLINRASYKSWHCSPLCCFSLAVLLVS